MNNLYEKIAIISDIHGFADRFKSALDLVEVDENFRVPPTTLIIQVGDLVHGNIEGQDEVVMMADDLLNQNPDNYIQLLGNHDAHYLGGPDVSSRPVFSQIDKYTQSLLQSWHEKQNFKLAASIRHMGQEILITHGGLTYNFFQQLGDTNAETVAQHLNHMLYNDPDTAYKSGWLVTGRYDSSVGVLSPRTGAELADSWKGHDLPFSQIHGHEGVWDWTHETWHDDVPDNIKEHSLIDHRLRQSRVQFESEYILSIDARFDSMPNYQPWKPLILKDAVLTS